MLEASEGDAKAAVTLRQNIARGAGATVTALAGACDAAFTVVVSPSRATVFAGRGAWQVDAEVVTGGKPDVAAAGRLANAACERLSKR
ncbi:MAG: hypothetical protein ACREON_07465 [Gemmatimonadaceae bacterium]